MNEVGMERCKTKTRGTTDRTVEAVEALVLEDLVPGAGDPDTGQVALYNLHPFSLKQGAVQCNNTDNRAK